MKLPDKWKDWYWAAIVIGLVIVALAIYGAWNRAEAQSGHVTVYPRIGSHQTVIGPRGEYRTYTIMGPQAPPVAPGWPSYRQQGWQMGQDFHTIRRALGPRQGPGYVAPARPRGGYGSER